FGGRTHLVSPQMAAAAAIAGHFMDVRTLKAAPASAPKPSATKASTLSPAAPEAKKAPAPKPKPSSKAAVKTSGKEAAQKPAKAKAPTTPKAPTTARKRTTTS
ncbi:MAG: hypothetical protein EB071_04205, partial [Gammaproteobacteria bacterium]|nr:hypothetical protein [Gammaproteobacteria bacterium]